MGDLGSIPGSGRSSGEGNDNPLQHPCLENPMDREVWYSPWGCKESDLTERLHFHFSLSCIKWLSRGSNSNESACNAGDLGSFPVSGRSPREGNDNPLQHSCLDKGACQAIYSPWGHKELDMNEWLKLSLSYIKYRIHAE